MCSHNKSFSKNSGSMDIKHWNILFSEKGEMECDVRWSYINILIDNYCLDFLHRRNYKIDDLRQIFYNLKNLFIFYEWFQRIGQYTIVVGMRAIQWIKMYEIFFIIFIIEMEWWNVLWYDEDWIRTNFVFYTFLFNKRNCNQCMS